MFALDQAIEDTKSEKPRTFTKGEKMRRFRKVVSLDISIPMKKVHSAPNTASFKLFDHFEMLETLGVGSYSYVRKASRNKDGRIVAIKICRKSTAREMLKNEYNILKKVTHDCVPKVYEFINNDKRDESYMVMEYFEGTTLRQAIEDGQEYSIDDVKQIMTQIFDCVSHLHMLQIGHRDIKPENVLLNGQNTVKLIDFNISKRTSRKSVSSEDSPTKFKSTFFTQISSPLYAAPELKDQFTYSESIDLWGCGVAMFVLLFGKFEDYNLNVLKDKDRLDTIHEVIDSSQTLDDEAKTLLIRLFSSDPEQRPTAFECLESEWFS